MKLKSGNKKLKWKPSLKPLLKRLTAPFILMFALTMMVGCNSITSSRQVIPSNLMQECDDLSELDGNTGKNWMLWSVQIVTKYNDCRLRHSGLIKARK